MKKYLALSTLPVLSIFFIIAGLLYRPLFHYPFKCYGFTEYNLVLGNKPVQLNLSHDIRFFDDKTGEFSFNGMVVYNNQNFIFNRKIKLTEASRIDNDTLKFTVKNTVKSVSDNSPEVIFNLFMNEYSASQHSLQIDLIEIEPSLWVISSPTSFIMMCQAY